MTGILPAVITPVGPDGTFIPDAFERFVQRLYDNGVDGVYTCGQTGEGYSQPAVQRKKVIEAAHISAGAG